jgi:hypothetical protein
MLLCKRRHTMARSDKELGDRDKNSFLVNWREISSGNKVLGQQDDGCSALPTPGPQDGRPR